MSRQIDSNDPGQGFPSRREFNQSGTISDADFTISSVGNPTKKIVFDVSAAPAGVNTILVSASGVQRGLQYSAPLTGASITIAAASSILVIEPAGTIATATIVLPTTPANGTKVDFSTTQTITGLTVSGGGSDTVVNAITTLTANSFASYVYRSSTAKWYRIG